MSLVMAARLGLGGNENYPDFVPTLSGLLDRVQVENGRVTMRKLPGIGFEDQKTSVVPVTAIAASRPAAPSR